MASLDKIVTAAMRKYERENGVIDPDEFVGISAQFNNGTLVIANEGLSLKVTVFLGPALVVDEDFSTHAIDAVFERLEEEFGDAELNEGDSIVATFNDALMIIGCEGGKCEIEGIIGKPYKLDMTLDM